MSLYDGMVWDSDEHQTITDTAARMDGYRACKQVQPAKEARTHDRP